MGKAAPALSVVSSGEEAEGRVRSLTRALALLRLVAQKGGTRGIGLVDLARLAGLHKSTVYRLASVLVREGFLARDEDSEKFRLGIATLELGSTYISNLTLRQEALPVLQRLMEETNETVHLGVIDQGQVVYIEKVLAPQNVIVHTQIGQRESVHSTALGRAILASMPEEAIERIIKVGLVARTKRTVTDPAEFRQALAEIRRAGYALNFQENREHINGAAAPIFDHTARPVAGIVISGLMQRLPKARLRELGLRLKAAAGEISRRMGYLGAS